MVIGGSLKGTKDNIDTDLSALRFPFGLTSHQIVISVCLSFMAKVFKYIRFKLNGCNELGLLC